MMVLEPIAPTSYPVMYMGSPRRGGQARLREHPRNDLQRIAAEHAKTARFIFIPTPVPDFPDLAIVCSLQRPSLGILIETVPAPRGTKFTIAAPGIRFRVGSDCSGRFPVASLCKSTRRYAGAHPSFDAARAVGHTVMEHAFANGITHLLVGSNNRPEQTGLPIDRLEGDDRSPNSITVDTVGEMLSWFNDEAKVPGVISFIDISESLPLFRGKTDAIVRRKAEIRSGEYQAVKMGSDCAGHLSPERIEEYLSDVLPSKCRLEVLHHLDGCADCNGAVREQMPHGERDH